MHAPLSSLLPLRSYRGRLALALLPALLLMTLAAHPVLAQGPVTSGVDAPAVGSGQAQPLEPGQTPAGLTAAEWAGIQAELAAAPYQAEPADDGGYGAANPAQGWRIGYEADGWTRLRPGERATAPWAWGLRLTGYGYQTLARLEKPAELEAAGPRLTYRWDANLSEWWINTAGGLEHGFTVRQRPRPGPGEANGRPLVVELAISGGLSPVRRGEGIAFWGAGGGAGPPLHPAGGVGGPPPGRLPARLALQAAGGGLRLVVDDAAAVYPLTIDPWVWAQEAYLKASNTGANDRFGQAVAVSGDTVVVGAINEDSSATGVNGNQSDNSAANSGAAYVFRRDSGGVWSQEAYLKASNTGASDNFGAAVAISGDTVVIGAAGEESSATGVNGNQSDNSFNDAGAAYVFRRDSNGVWAQEAYLKASNTDSVDLFGTAVAISGDTVVVGAVNESSNATGVNGNQSNNSAAYSGAAYVFVRDSGGVWAQEAYLKASNTGASDNFGNAVAISGDTVVVGANNEDSSATGVNGDGSDNSADNAGAAYVFGRDSGGVWSQEAYLKASNTGATDYFGRSVAISGDTVVIGAYQEDSSATGVNGNQSNNSFNAAGAAYVFRRDSGGEWSQEAYLKASNTEAGDWFGPAVAISGDTVVIGAEGEDSSATGANGDESGNAADNAGAAYVFGRSGTTWSQQAYLKASNTGAGDTFGTAVAISGDTVVVGAYQEDSNATGVNGDGSNNSVLTSGAAYVFGRSAQPPVLTAHSPLTNSVAASLNSSVVLTYSAAMDAASVTSRTVAIHSMMQGLVTGTHSVNGAVVTVNPSRSFFPGELVYASATTATTDLAGMQPLTPTVWQFNAAAGAGPGEFPLTHTVTTAADGARSVGAADVDGDGDLDLLSASGYDDKIAWYENDGSGSFTTIHTVTTTADVAYSVAAADVDGDGDLDLLSASSWDDKIAWYENDGATAPTFTAHTVTTAANFATSVGAADVDGDGDLDLLSASANDGKIAWYENDGITDPTFTAYTVTTTAAGANSVGAADVDGDGDIDLLSASSSGGTRKIVWYENDEGDGTPFTAYTVTTAVNGAMSVAAADVDGDGDLDLLSASEANHKIAWYENDGASDPSFTAHTVTLAAYGAQSVAAADVDGDSDLDLLAASLNIDQIAWYENVGGSDFTITHTVTLAANGANSVGAADVDGDGDLDLLSASSNDDKIAWYENAVLPDVTLVKSVTPTSAKAGDAITYTLTFSNAGPGTATGVIITDSVPVSVTGVSVSRSGAVITDTGATPAYVWQVQDLSPNESGIITLTGVLSSPLAAGIFTNTATITATVDSNPANNSDTAEVTVMPVSCPTANPIYVDRDATGGSNSGDSWANAFTDLQNGLLAARFCAGLDEIWVAAGVYTPGLTQSDTFTITSGMQLYGGFAATETMRTQRDWLAHPTILSGDIDGNDTNINGVVTDTTQINGVNATHVIWADGVSTPITATTIVDGFTITAGQANRVGFGGLGGGFLCFGGGSGHECSPSLSHLTFSGNSATQMGGAIFNNGYLYGSSSPSLTNITFSGNSASYSGGAMANYGDNYGSSSPSLTNVAFSDNWASSQGGAMFNSGDSGGTSSPRLNNVTFSGNSASYGGAMANSNSSAIVSPRLTNVTFSGNWASDQGGAMYAFGNDGISSPSLTNVTFSGNRAANQGGAMYSYGTSGSGGPLLTNVILWGNQAAAGNQLYMIGGASPVLSYTLIQSGTNDIYTNSGSSVTFGPGIRTTNPLFEVPVAATAAPTTTGNYRLWAGSPAVDTGLTSAITLTTDLDGNPRIQGNAVDLGAYEGYTCPSAGPLYVDQDAAGGNGQSWANAFTNLQTALAVARACAGLDEIWVAAGVYTPGLARTDTFTLTSGLQLYGGFAATETLRTQRDWAANPTILSGDIGGDDTNTDGNYIAETIAAIAGSNAYHVIWADGVSNPITATTILDGFTITAGQATGSNPNDSGGGFYCAGNGSGHECSPSLSHLTFSGNQATNGGAMYNYSYRGISSPSLTNVTFSGNLASYAGRCTTMALLEPAAPA